MIASSAALFALMATLAAGQKFTILPTPATRDQSIQACSNAGLQLAAITGASIEQVSAQLPAGAAGWIASWNGDAYGGACLQLKTGTITAAASCLENHLPVCEGVVVPHVPSCSSSSPHESTSTCSELPESSTGCDLSSSAESFSSSYECDESSSFSCSENVSSDICSSSAPSSSSSSVDKCDPCCAGVRKLTYQAPFGAGIYLGKVTQRFSVFDAFGPNACSNVQSLAQTLGVNAVLVGSDGLNACSNLDTFPYGTTYVVSRAWALNQPIYSLLNGVVSAANSIYNCYGEYRAIYLTKELSDLSFVTNSNGDTCFQRCKGKPTSCVAICQANFARPSYQQKFEIGH